MSAWQKNAGTPPRQIAGVPIARVFVHLRGGIQPADSWPVDTGRRGETTRWTLLGDEFDITEWKPA